MRVSPVTGPLLAVILAGGSNLLRDALTLTFALVGVDAPLGPAWDPSDFVR